MAFIAQQAAKVALKAALLNMLASHVDEDDGMPETSPTHISATLEFALIESSGDYTLSYDAPRGRVVECGGGSL